MPTFATVPTYAAPNREAAVTIPLAQSGSNYVRLWVTNAPPESKWREKLEAAGDSRSRIQVYEGPGTSTHQWRETFDKGGRYVFKAQEYLRGSAFGGGYQHDPDSAPSETKVGAETDYELFIGQRVASEIGVVGDRATLVFWIWDESIRATTKGVHGEATPAIQSDSPTTRVQVAIETTTVQTALDALVGVTAAAAAGTVATIMSDMARQISDHMQNAGGAYHDVADVENDIPAGLRTGPTPAGLATWVNSMLPYIRQHYTNDAVLGGVDSGVDSGNYHNVGGVKVNDRENMPLFDSVGEKEAYWALADLWRSFEAHRVSVVVHNSADSTNALAALPVLLQVAALFYGVMASLSPTTPDTQSDGVVQLIAKTNCFEETPL